VTRITRRARDKAPIAPRAAAGGPHPLAEEGQAADLRMDFAGLIAAPYLAHIKRDVDAI
jgi:hypothetical protein